MSLRSDVDAQGRQAMVCKKAPGRVARHQVLNDIILRAINAADVPAVKEPSGLNRQDGKRSDGFSLIPWRSGKPLLWDVTVASTLARSYVDTAATGVGLVADQAADRKTVKYADLGAQYMIRSACVTGKPGSTQFFYTGLSERLRSQYLSYFRWWQRGSVPLSKNPGHDSTF